MNKFKKQLKKTKIKQNKHNNNNFKMKPFNKIINKFKL